MPHISEAKSVDVEFFGITYIPDYSGIYCETCGRAKVKRRLALRSGLLGSQVLFRRPWDKSTFLVIDRLCTLMPATHGCEVDIDTYIGNHFAHAFNHHLLDVSCLFEQVRVFRNLNQDFIVNKIDDSISSSPYPP